MMQVMSECPGENPTRTLHRLTSLGPYDESTIWEPPVDDPRVLGDLVVNDLDRLPWFYKRYPESRPRLELPAELPATTASAADVLAGTAEVAAAELNLAQLARILHLCAGVVRTSPRSYGEHLFRAAGSAGGRFPLELYVAGPEGNNSVPAGVYWYHPQDHCLVLIGPPPEGDALVLVVTGVPWRTGWRYRERGYRHIYWDAGTMLSQLLAAAESAGLPAHLHSRFPDQAVAGLVGADGVNEWPVAIVALGEGTPAISATGPAAAGEVDRAPVEFPLVTSAQRAGDQDTLGPAWDRGGPAEVLVRTELPVETVVLARGSQRRMDASRAVPIGLLRTLLGAALRGITVPHWIAVHNVDGLAPGLYRWPDTEKLVRAGELRDELYHLCLDQGLGRDAAFVVIAAADLGGADDREYREAQLAAGLVEGRLHLLAYALGVSASGMTFADSLLPESLGEPLDGLLLTCVGVPEYASAPGGRPGSPTSVRIIAPRE
jgi:SagB-type dehydrogenase family enzyme